MVSRENIRAVFVLSKLIEIWKITCEIINKIILTEPSNISNGCKVTSNQFTSTGSKQTARNSRNAQSVPNPSADPACLKCIWKHMRKSSSCQHARFAEKSSSQNRFSTGIERHILRRRNSISVQYVIKILPVTTCSSHIWIDIRRTISVAAARSHFSLKASWRWVNVYTWNVSISILIDLSNFYRTT